MKNFYKKKKLTKNILIVDGQPGCGKTLFNRIFNSFKNIEIFKYSSEIENLTSFYYHKKISFDAAKFFLETYTDENLYSQMMGRNTNFRYSDLSSVFQSSKKIEYIKRIFNRGDEVIPDLINKKKPILHFATHNVFPRSEILFKTFEKNLRFINIVRHPIYMIHQQALNHIEFFKNPARQLTQTFEFNKKEVPIIWEKKLHLYDKIHNPFEKAIFQMNEINNINKTTENKIIKKYKKNFLKIPFEIFVLKPDKFKSKIEKFLNVKYDKSVLKTLKKEKVPRSKIIDGRDVPIYRKYGWKDGNRKFNEKEEILNKFDFIKSQKVSIKLIDILKKLSEDYENDYLRKIL